MSILSGKFQGILKSPSILGLESSFNTEVKKSGNSARNVSICTGVFFEYGSL